MKYLLIASAALGGILLFLLAAASADTSLFAGHYSILLVFNAAIALALISLVGWQLWTLRRALKERKFGSKLTLRFLLIFALMAALPGALVYTVSVQFLAKSIESWFNVRVDAALDVGLDLGRSVLDDMLSDVRRSARNMALELSDLPLQQQGAELNRLREQAGVNEASIVTTGGAVLYTASSTLTQLVPEPPPAHVLRQVKADREYGRIEAVGERGLQSRVLIQLPASGWGAEVHVLQLIQPVPASVAESVETVQAAQRDYKELSLLRTGLKRIYILTLTLALLLALFSAIALAFILSRRLSMPLAILAEATHAVARGDFTRRAKVTSRDELGILTKSFNSMTEQLDEARTQAERNQQQVESAKAYLENILGNLSAGVMTFDEAFRLQIVNAGATTILNEPLERGRALAGSSTLQDLDKLIRTAFAES
ncbi:MAG TPA: HAMP domain-containing protein, partial [Burkholderiales bacterium]|nr:HAMP domain-containing protein [Burkholderiales bacterium]